MSRLDIHPENDPGRSERHTDPAAIAAHLSGIGIRFERWEAAVPLDAGATQDEILAAYRQPIDRLMREEGMQSVDVLGLRPDHPDRAALRSKFLAEHTHSENEIRFFVEGRGLFYIHAQGQVFAVVCERGDLIGIPDGTPHWFDMGEAPHFTAIRLFTSQEGWVARFTGSDIAKRFPLFEG